MYFYVFFGLIDLDYDEELLGNYYLNYIYK